MRKSGRRSDEGRSNEPYAAVSQPERITVGGDVRGGLDLVSRLQLEVLVTIGEYKNH